jgi:hypothetical protein
MIDRELVQHLIETEISPDFEMDKWYDSGPYIIISWKHKRYSRDDERGMIVGPGPMVYFKAKKEYRILGSGEWFYGDYADFLDPGLFAEEKRKNNVISNLLDEVEVGEEKVQEIVNDIKAAILKRDYINSDDINDLCILFGVARGTAPFNMTRHPGYNREIHLMVVFNNQEVHKKLIAFWEEIGFGYVIVSGTELVLFKTRDGS